MEARKNIAINLLFVSPQRGTGSFIYVRNLLDELFVLDKNNIYFLILAKDSYLYFKDRYKNCQNIKFCVLDAGLAALLNPVKTILKLLAKIKRDHGGIEKIIRKEVQCLINKNNINMVFFPSGTMYPTSLEKIRTVTTIFDLQHEYFPDNFTKEYLDHRRKESVYVASNSDRIIAISEFTKKTLMEKYGTDGNKIIVTYLAPQKEIADKQPQINLPDNFIFYPAAIWPHKNHKILIQAMNLLKSNFPDLHLVFSGQFKNKKLKEMLETLAESYDLKDKVHFLGFVSDTSLSLIYKKAKVLIYPSSFEGFGIPLVEAFEHGVPVIAADNTSIREIVGTAGLLVETGDTESFAEAIKRVLSDENLRQNLILRGRERVQDFSWTKTAIKTLELFNSL